MDDEYTDGFYLIGESPLEVDEEEDDVRAEYLPSIGEALRLLGRDNRVAIVARKPVPTPPLPFHQTRPPTTSRSCWPCMPIPSASSSGRT